MTAGPAGDEAQPAWIAELLRPVASHPPCGPDLGYDHDYAMLEARMRPRDGAQYGDFVDTPASPDWSEIERDSRRLLSRTKDIRVIVWLCRARTRLAQARGLKEGLSLLSDALRAWPGEVHPQIRVDGEHEPALRANALALLVDPQGLWSDVLDVVVVPGAAGRLTVRDIERAFAVPRPPGASDATAVARELATLRTQGPDDARRMLADLEWAARHAHAIDAWARTHLRDDAPGLERLTRSLDRAAGLVRPAAPAPAASSTVGSSSNMPAVFADTGTESAGGAPTSADATPSCPRAGADHHAMPPAWLDAGATRQEALLAIRSIRRWFEDREPSSPVPVLLGQAERLVGQSFARIVQSFPVDLLKQWDAELRRDEPESPKESGR